LSDTLTGMTVVSVASGRCGTKCVTTTLTSIANYVPDRRREYTHETQHRRAKDTTPHNHEKNARSPVSAKRTAIRLSGDGRHEEGIMRAGLLVLFLP
jgi:aspartokinase